MAKKIAIFNGCSKSFAQLGTLKRHLLKIQHLPSTLEDTAGPAPLESTRKRGHDYDLPLPKLPDLDLGAEIAPDDRDLLDPDW